MKFIKWIFVRGTAKTKSTNQNHPKSKGNNNNVDVDENIMTDNRKIKEFKEKRWVILKKQN